MQVFDTIKGFQDAVLALRSDRKRLGFVPTMGALHKGHMSLVELAIKDNDLVAVSIFVNPSQFNNPEDLKNYPRTLEADLKLLSEYKPDLVFCPSVEEIYPKNHQVELNVELGLLEKMMEGKHRPGHFKGVVRVVARLFEIVKPDTAYFGVKDFQQLAVIREMTAQLGLGVEIRSGDTIRDSDGLAMSSRNVLLNPQQRTEAVKISKALFYMSANWRTVPIQNLRENAIRMMESGGLMKVEYLEIADSNTLEPLSSWEESSFPRVFVAVQVGKVRLIDNIGIDKSNKEVQHKAFTGS
jgi:pantoate--beta-alanine ligase